MPIYLPETTQTSTETLTPRQIVAELDKYVIGQASAKGAVAIALRNRMRRHKLTPELAERVRKIGGLTLRSIGHISKLQTIDDNDAEFVAPREMLRELMNDNKAIAKALRETHEIADKHDDAATASLLENVIDATEKRTWFLFEASRKAESTGH